MVSISFLMLQSIVGHGIARELVAQHIVPFYTSNSAQGETVHRVGHVEEIYSLPDVVEQF